MSDVQRRVSARQAESWCPGASTEDAWSPFGWLPVADTDPRDGAHRMTFEWADAHVNLIGHTLDEVPETARGLRCEMLYRHDTHTQSLLCTQRAGRHRRGARQGRVHRTRRTPNRSAPSGMEPLESLVLHLGTWHWGPFPIRAPEVRLFNVQGLRYAEDNRCMDLASRGLSIEVDLT